MSSNTRQRSRQERKRGTRPLLKNVFVVCEGELTERRYFDALKHTDEFQSATNLTLSKKHGVPSRILPIARAELANFDEVWCVFDVESPNTHPNLDLVIAEAERDGIKVALSNRCFELWLILHDRDRTGYLTTDGAVKQAQKIPEVVGKDIKKPDQLVRRRDEAKRRAQQLRRQMERDGENKLSTNPYTDVDVLIDSMLPP